MLETLICKGRNVKNFMLYKKNCINTKGFEFKVIQLNFIELINPLFSDRFNQIYKNFKSQEEKKGQTKPLGSNWICGRDEGDFETGVKTSN